MESKNSGRPGLVLQAILFSLLGILLLVGFIVLRRWYRARYFRRRNERTVALRSQWDDILSGKISAKDWRFDPLDCDIVESILLDSIEMSSADKLPPLLDCLRVSGLLDMRIYEARTSRGWKQRTALLTLGRTRAAEAIPALAEGLDSRLRETRIAAVRGLGRTARMEAAIPILDRIVTGQFDAPERSLKNALVNCCRANPEVLVNYVEQTDGPVRELLARVLGELASPELGEELLVLAADSLPEVRASAARALGNTNTSYTSAGAPQFSLRPRMVCSSACRGGAGTDREHRQNQDSAAHPLRCQPPRSSARRLGTGADGTATRSDPRRCGRHQRRLRLTSFCLRTRALRRHRENCQRL